jgi:demethylmenaquinone methyltransferase/2-methoxy-6-polyprenyl-1,4-benzoquinol methylase
MSEDPYCRVARIYDRLFEPVNRNLRELGMRLYPPGKGARVLDVGCGTGVHLDLYRRAGCEPFGIDASPAMLDVARERLGPGADLRVGDATRMPYADASFDLILCMLVLHEMEQGMRLSVLSEMQRVLASGGRILLIDYHAGPARRLKGWLTKIFILLAERAAGRRHYRNYQHFMSLGGVPALIAGSRLAEEQRKIVAGGTLVLHVLRSAGNSVPPQAVP